MLFASEVLSGRMATKSTIGTFLANIKHNLVLRAAYRRTMNELSMLSDSALADLGISRDQIPSAARETIYGNKA